jgi:hypothetical protein
MENQDTEKPLEKMTVKELREMAKDLPGITGLHAMKKDELLEALGGAGGKGNPGPKAASARKAKTAGPSMKSFSRAQLKEKICDLREKRKTALEEQDKDLASIIRRKINKLKKHTRKAPSLST